MAEFSHSLAKTIIERVGEKKEAWMVFDMDETLAHWKKTKNGDIFYLHSIGVIQTRQDFP